MDLQPVSKIKHHSHSRILEQRDLERMRTSADIIKSCQETVRISRELVRASQAAVQQIRKNKKR